MKDISLNRPQNLNSIKTEANDASFAALLSLRYILK